MGEYIKPENAVRNLASSVIHQAIKDIVDIGTLIKSDVKISSSDKLDYDRAFSFIQGKERAWATSKKYWCDLAGISPHKVNIEAIMRNSVYESLKGEQTKGSPETRET